MQAGLPASPRRPDWKPAHAQRLSYRNSATADPSQRTASKNAHGEVSRNTSAARSTTSSRSNISGSTANVSTPSTSRGNDRSSRTSKAPVLPTPQKKKGLFGGLFVTKEPTALALERFSAQLAAQHGELSARAIPGVSSAKLPEHVPKVNAKWDGVPEALKERDRLQKEKVRASASKRQSLASSVRSRSAEGSRLANARPGERRPPLHERSSTSTLGDFDSSGRRGRPEESQSGSSVLLRSPSYTSSSASLNPVKSASIRSQSLRTPSGSSLPHITAFFPNDIPSAPAIPTRCTGEGNTHPAGSSHTKSTGRTLHDHAEALAEPTIDMVPEHTSSPTGTPLDRSPVTPSPMAQLLPSSRPSNLPAVNDKPEEAGYFSSGGNVLGPPATASTKRTSKTSGDAFLAGEARPLELPDDEPGPAVHEYELRSPHRASKAPELSALARVQKNLEQRPDSSRVRLGLRASMLIDTDQTSWNWQDLDQNPDVERSGSPRLSMPVVPKRLSKVLGKTNK